MKSGLWIGLCGAMSWGVFSFAQTFDIDAVPLPEEVRVSNMPSNIQLDKLGYLWLFNAAKAWRLEGTSMREFHSSTLLEGSIKSVYVDCQSVPWVGWSSGQLAQVKNDSIVPLAFEEGHPRAAIQAWAEDRQQRLWLGTYGEGVYMLDRRQTRWYLFDLDDGLGSTDVYDLCVAPDSTGVWAATDRGLFYLTMASNGDKLCHPVILENCNRTPVVTEIASHRGHIVIQTFEQGSWCYQNGQWKQLQENRTEDFERWSLGDAGWAALDTRGRAWFQMPDKVWLPIQIPEAGQLVLQDVAIDQEAHLWMVSDQTLYKARVSHVHYYASEAVGSLGFINDRLFIARGSLLEKVQKGGKRKQLWEAPAPIVCLLNQGQLLWAGTFGKGLYLLDTSGVVLRHWEEEVGLVNNNVLTLSVFENQLWYGSLAGIGMISQLQGSNSFQVVPIESPPLYVYKIAADSAGVIWVATDGDGLLQWNNHEWSPAISGTEGKTILDVIAAPEGGLYWMSDLGEVGYLTPSGLSQTLPMVAGGVDEPSSLFFAPSGSIGMVHSSGVNIWNVTAQGWQQYGRSFGLEYLQAGLHAVANTPEEWLCVGGAQGLTLVNIQQLEQTPPPTLQLAALELFFNPVGDTSFSWNANHWSFQWSSRWYTDPSRLQYQVQLEGFDLAPYITKDEKVSYPRLPPGKYRFSVRPIVAGHLFEPLVQKTGWLRIARPWWQQTWFIATSMGLFVLAFWYWNWWRIQRAQRIQEQEKEHIKAQYEALKSQLSPHFLFNSFNTLMGLIEERPLDAKDYLQDLSELFRQILQLREQSLIPLEHELTIAQRYIALQKRRFNKAFEVSIEIPPGELHKLLPPLSLQLLLENALKHNVVSKLQPLKISIFIQDHRLWVTNPVNQRNGPKPPSTGYGLQSLKKKYILLSEEEVSVLEEAAYFSVVLPLIERSYENGRS